MDLKTLSTPKDIAIKELQSAISEFKIVHPTIVEQEYIHEYINLFSSYLDAIDMLNFDLAEKVIELGINCAETTSNLVNDSSQGADLLYYSIQLEELIDLKKKGCSTIKYSVLTKEPTRFIDNPYVDSAITNKARITWANNVQKSFHLIAKRYVKRDSRVFTKDEVLSKYGELLKSKMKRKNAFESIFEWVESYNISKGELYDQIGIQIENLESFHREYKRWLNKQN